MQKVLGATPVCGSKNWFPSFFWFLPPDKRLELLGKVHEKLLLLRACGISHGMTHHFLHTGLQPTSEAPRRVQGRSDPSCRPETAAQRRHHSSRPASGRPGSAFSPCAREPGAGRRSPSGGLRGWSSCFRCFYDNVITAGYSDT